MQVVYEEMTHNGEKSYLAKLNLIDGIQFRHVKNCLMFMFNVQIGLWMLFSWYVMECKLFGG